MGFLEELTEDQLWQEFLERKKEQKSLSPREEKELADYVKSRRYKKQAEEIRRGAAFPIPEKHRISKTGTDKKRTVYEFSGDFGYLLKMAAWRLYRYDGIFADNLWSFRSGKTVRQGIRHLLNGCAGHEWYSCKVDIHNYFNSIPVHRLLPMLENIFGKMRRRRPSAAAALDPRAVFGGKIVVRKKGPWRGCRCPLFLPMYI